MKIILFLLAVSASPSFSAVVYSNTTNDTGSTIQYLTNGFTAIGDQITLAGSERFATSATAQFFSALSTSGTFTATLSFYNVGAGNSVGSLLNSYVVNSIAISGFDLANPLTSGVTTVTFSSLNLTVPTDLMFAIDVSSVVNADLGLTVFDPPTVGSSDANSVLASSGAALGVTSANPGLGNVNFSLNATSGGAVPEPGTFVALGAGLAVLFALRRRHARV